MDYSTKNQATFIVNFRKREKEIDWNRGGVDTLSSVTLATACTDVFWASVIDMQGVREKPNFMKSQGSDEILQPMTPRLVFNKKKINFGHIYSSAVKF